MFNRSNGDVQLKKAFLRYVGQNLKVIGQFEGERYLVRIQQCNRSGQHDILLLTPNEITDIDRKG